MSKGGPKCSFPLFTKANVQPCRLHLFFGKLFFVLSVFFSPFAKTRLWWNSLNPGPFLVAPLFQEGGVQSYWVGGRASDADHPPSVLSRPDLPPHPPPQPWPVSNRDVRPESIPWRSSFPCLICFPQSSLRLWPLSRKARMCVGGGDLQKQTLWQKSRGIED